MNTPAAAACAALVVLVLVAGYYWYTHKSGDAASGMTSKNAHANKAASAAMSNVNSLLAAPDDAQGNMETMCLRLKGTPDHQACMAAAGACGTGAKVAANARSPEDLHNVPAHLAHCIDKVTKISPQGVKKLMPGQCVPGAYKQFAAVPLACGTQSLLTATGEKLIPWAQDVARTAPACKAQH